MAERKPISKKLRFEVFKRDYFKCQYCGSVPPNTVLEVDHITPVYSGGKNNIDNLITACFDCNRGKGKDELSIMPDSTAEKALILKQKLSQYKAFIKLQSEMESLIELEIERANDLYNKLYPGWVFTDKFKTTSLRKFILSIGLSEVLDSLLQTSARIENSRDATKYFCGICWSKIRERS